jgi:hypothetical protein
LITVWIRNARPSLTYSFAGVAVSGVDGDFTYGRVMSWVPFVRAIRLAGAHGRPAPIERWISQRDALYEQVMHRGWDGGRGAFVQHYDDKCWTPLCCACPASASLPARPMWLSTLRAMDSELVTDRVVYRYDPGASPDVLRGSEGTFSLCTFMYLYALARARRLEDARLAFEKMLTTPIMSACLRRDRNHRRTARQLPASLHPPGTHRCRDHTERSTGSAGPPLRVTTARSKTALRWALPSARFDALSVSRD